MTASENEANFLIGASAERRSHEIFWSLVKSGSSKAVPLILELVENDGYGLVSFVRSNEAAMSALKSATGFDALTKALPDLTGADPESFEAVMKV